MVLDWVVLAVIGVVLLFTLVRILSRMIGEREAARRRKQAAAMHPMADDTTTYAGHS